MSTRIKICGLNSPAAFDAAIEAGAEWVGFVFFPPSPRYVTPAQAASLNARLLGGPPRVGLFVEPTLAAIGAVLTQVRLDVVQVYGAIDAAAIRREFGVQVWRAVGVSRLEDLPTTMEGADALLLDAKPPKDATRPGGNAQSFDWGILHDWSAPGPWVLAGGLTPDNVAAAISVSGAPAVDVSSGVETAPGVKSPDLIRAFIRAACGT